MTLRKIEFYIPIFLLIMMIYRNSWIIGGSDLYVKDVYLVCFFTLCILILRFNIKSFFDFKFRVLLQHPFFLFLFVSFAFSLFLLNTQEISGLYNLCRLSAFFCYIYLYFYLLADLITDSEFYFKKFIKFIYYLGSFISITGILFLFTGFNPYGLYKGMLISFSIHPNYLASLLIYTVFTSVYIFLNHRDSKLTFDKYLVLFSILLQIYALLLTLSRASVLGFAAGAVVFSFYIFRKKYLLIIYPIALVILPPYLILFTESKGISSFLSRFLLLVPAYYMVNDNMPRLLFGYGATNAFPEYEKAKLFYNMFVEENINNPHNMYVSLVLMFGLVFTILFLIVLIGFFYKTFKKAKKASKDERIYYGFIFSTLVALLVQGIFESQVLMPEFYSLHIFLLFLGLLYRYYYNKPVTSFKKISF